MVDSPSASVNDQVIELHEALEKLALSDPDTVELVKLRYFVGMKMSDVAKALDLKKRKAERRLAYAQAWLSREMQGSIGI